MPVPAAARALADRPRGLPRRLAAVTLPVLVALCASSPVVALTDEEVFRSLRFATQTPGSRALGLGGAFIGQSDDATAAFTNPSGLGFLERPQLLAEVRSSDPEELAFSQPGAFDLFGAETFARGTLLLDDDSVVAPSFLGYVHPIGERWSVGVHRHELLNVEREVASVFTTTAFPPLEGGAPGVSREALATRGDLDLLIDTFGVSVGVTVHEQLSLGLTVSLARLDLTQRSTNFISTPVDLDDDGTFDTLLRSIDYSTVIDDDDTAATFTAGLLWRAHPRISVGLVYRDGPEFDVVETVLPEGLRAKALRDHLVTPRTDGTIIGNSLGEFINTISVPDSWGVGLHFGPFFEPRGGGGLTVNVDAVQVEYTDLLDNYVAGLNNQLFGADSAGVVFELDDETEVHVGIGYTWTVGFNNQVHVRAGAYNEPDVSVLTAGRSSPLIDPATGAPVRPGAFSGLEDDDQVHFTLGAGFMLKRGFYSFEFDAVADFSEDLGEIYSGSAIFKF